MLRLGFPTLLSTSALLSLLTSSLGYAGGGAGELLQAREIVTYSVDELEKQVEDTPGSSTNGVEIRNGVRYFSIRYTTTGVDGKTANATGLMIVPTGSDVGPVPVVSYQHGTFTRRKEAPSQDLYSGEVRALTLLFAARGYAVVLADGLGMGKSDGDYHPFLHAETEAASSYDLLVAAKPFFRERRIALTDELFLAGYSQGGHWTMALHRALDANPIPGYRVVLSAPMAGPYDLSGVAISDAFERPGQFSGFYSGYIFYALHRAYPDVAPNWSAAVRAPYDVNIPIAFSGKKSILYGYRKLPKKPVDFLTPEYYADFEKDPHHPLREALRKNDVYDWAPQEPVLLIHSRADNVVSYENSEVALRAMTAKGGNVQLVAVPGKLGHVAAFLPALKIAAKNFHPFLRPAVNAFTQTFSAFFNQTTKRVWDVSGSR